MRWLRAFRWGVIGWIAWRLLGPEAGPHLARGQVRPVRVPGRTVFVGERELFVREAGPADGPVLVLVHGWGFDGEMTFHRIIEPLAEHFRVIIPDHRNHGKSDWVRGRYEVTDLADDLAGVLDALDVRSATFFGYSLGGLVVQELARRQPGRVARMILGATAALPVRRLRPAARTGMWVARSLARFSTHEIAALSARIMVRTGALDPKHERWMRAALLRRDATLFYEAGHAAYRFDARSWAGRLEPPALVVITERDQIMAPVAQRELSQLLSSPEVVTMPSSGHESIMTDSEQWVDLIKRFAG